MNKPLLTLTFLLASTSSFATVLVDEDFSHADGALVGQSPATGGTWTAHSGAGNKPVQVASGQISLDQSSGSGEDINTSFMAMGSGDRIFAGFDLTLPSGQTVNPDANGLYFAHFKDGGTSNFRARVFITAPSGGGDFGIGLDGNGSTPSVVWAGDLAFDTTYKVVVSYDYDSGDTELWVDPVDEMSTSITDMAGTASTAIEAFALRQSNDYTGSQVIDNLSISDVFSESLPVELMQFGVE
ncbi:MAG: hypothetical protein DHS20C11_24650 [Lysobacteraceae bacterium]|nr:MAG: hypothetical protein DHS20C11_24650 [Xanthomonadaceae bacterium]